MANETKKPKIQIALTSEQREQLKQATGTDVKVVELDAEELEERIAPVTPRC
jgi:hypothetical protein